MGGFSALLNIFNRFIPRPFPRMFYIDSSSQRKAEMEIFLLVTLKYCTLFARFLPISDIGKS